MIKLQKYLIDKVDEASIIKFDNQYWVKINANTKEYDDLLIELADSNLLDSSINLNNYFEYSNIKSIALKRFEQSFEKRIEKIDGVEHAKVKMNVVQNAQGEVIKDKCTIIINVNILNGTNIGKIQKIISNLIPLDRHHTTININILS